MEDSRTKILGSAGTPSSATGVVGGNSHKDELSPNCDDDDAVDCDFADVPADSTIDVRASLPRGFGAIHDLCHFGNTAVPEDAIWVFSLTLQSLTVVLKRDSAVSPKTVVPERVHFVEEPAALNFSKWTLENIYMVCVLDESHAAIERLNTEIGSTPRTVF